MHTLSSDQMMDTEAGGLLWCGMAMGVTGLGGFFSRILAKYFSGLPLGCVDAAVSTLPWLKRSRWLLVTICRSWRNDWCRSASIMSNRR